MIMEPTESNISLREAALSPGPGGRRHVAAARAVRRGNAGRAVAAPGLQHAVLLGADGMALILAQLLAGAGVRVSIVELDCDVAERLGTRLGQLGLAVPVLADPVVALAAIRRATLLVQGAATPVDSQLAEFSSDAQTVLLCETEAEARAFLSASPHRPGRAALRLAVPGSGLAEVFVTDHVSDRTGPLDSIMASLGCTPIRLLPGQSGPLPRLLTRYLATAEALCLVGAAPWELDEALEDIGFQFGPCALMDRLGVDSVLPRRKRLQRQGCILPDPGIIRRMVAEGRLGRKSSVGWYRYPGGGGRVTDPLIEDLVREEAWFARIPQRSFDSRQMQAHIIAVLVAEAELLLAENAISHASDADLAAVLALGFPPQLGGPLWLSDRLGPDWRRAAMLDLQADLEGIADALPPDQP